MTPDDMIFEAQEILLGFFRQAGITFTQDSECELGHCLELVFEAAVLKAKQGNTAEVGK